MEGCWHGNASSTNIQKTGIPHNLISDTKIKILVDMKFLEKCLSNFVKIARNEKTPFLMFGVTSRSVQNHVLSFLSGSLESIFTPKENNGENTSHVEGMY